MNPFSKLHHRRGAAMTETVLVMPLLLVILSLVFYFGRMMVRVQHTQVMARYETWRSVIDAPGPHDDYDLGDYSDLNQTFFASNAEGLEHTTRNDAFPEEAYEELIAQASRSSEAAGDLAERLLYQPSGDTPRFSHGRSEGFRVTYTTDVPLWRELEGPIRRRHTRIGHEWHFSHNWTAGPDEWRGSAQPPHHLRALRDAFLEEFDNYLDGIDGDSGEEYPSDPTQTNNNQVLAGFLRSLYLDEPAYRGPIVYDEREQ